MSESDFVMLESEDGYTFVVPRKVACASGTLRSMLDEDGEFESIQHLGSIVNGRLTRYSCDVSTLTHSRIPRSREQEL